MRALRAFTWALLVQNARNRVALVYGFVFPLLFLLAFWAIYAAEVVPLALHAGQFLTVTILGTACFGLPTALVAEREQGVWRRYALMPVPVAVLVAGTLLARLVLLGGAVAVQLALAFVLGMPAPVHGLGMGLGLLAVAGAFLGLGAVMAMVVTSVPAVQAVGQAVFLPMLIIGGVAVPLTSLPDWAVPVSFALPGRAAVSVLQACQTGAGLGSVGPELVVLGLNAVVGFVVAVVMFRWAPAGPGERMRRPWALLGLVGLWVAAALWLGRAETPVAVDAADAGVVADYVKPPVVAAPVAQAPVVEEKAAPVVVAPVVVTGWRGVTAAQIGDVAYDRLPPDAGLVAPVAGADEVLDPLVQETLALVSVRLEDWPPGQVDDLEQRVRNLLYVAAVPDVLQQAGVERGLPLVVLAEMRRSVPADDLPKLLYWVATHPDGGDDAAVGEMERLGLPGVSGPTRQVRGRVMLYAFKLLGRVMGVLPGDAGGG